MSSERVWSVVGVVDTATTTTSISIAERSTAILSAGMCRLRPDNLNLRLIEGRWRQFDASEKHRFVDVRRLRDLVIHPASVSTDVTPG